MPTVCRTAQQAQSQAENGRRKVAWSVSDESVIRSRAKAQNKLHELARASAVDDIEAQNLKQLQAIEAAQREIEAVTVDMLKLKPQEYSKMENMLARELGVHQRALGIADDLTQAGAVKLALVDIKRHAQAVVDVAGRWASLKSTRQAVATARGELKRVGVRGAQADEFIDNVLEVGAHPRVRLAYGNTEAINDVLARRYNAMRTEAANLGLSDGALDNIVDSANRAASAWDKMRTVGNLLGQNIDEVTNIGYTPRQLTEKALRYFELQALDSNSLMTRGIGSTPMEQSRSTWQLIPLDMQVLSEVLTKKGTRSWDDLVRGLVQYEGVTSSSKAIDSSVDALFEARRLFAQGRKQLRAGTVTREEVVKLAKEVRAGRRDLKLQRRLLTSNKKGQDILSYSEQLAKQGGDDAKTMQVLADELGMPLDELKALRATHNTETEATYSQLAELWNDGMAFTEHLHKNVSASQLDDLVDAGIMSKIPMTAREVYDYMSRQYPLPWQSKAGAGISDMFEMSIEKRIETYRETLREAAGQSFMVKNITSKGVEQGWAVPTSGLLPEHAGFKELSGIDLTRFGVDPTVAKEWAGLHVHPTVYDQLQGQLTMMTNPGVLSTFGQALSFVNKNFQVITLAGQGIPFLARNVYGGMRVGLAAGMNPLKVLPAFREVAAVLKDGLEVLDNSKPFLKDGAEWITKQEAFKRYFIRRGASYVGAESGQSLGFGVQQSGAHRLRSYMGDTFGSLPGALKQMVDYSKMHPDTMSGLLGAAKLGTKQFDEYVNTVFAPIAYGNALADNAFKWATITSTMETHGVSDTVRKGLQHISDTHSMGNMADSVKHLDQYFIDHASLGNAQKAIAKYVKPFGTFAMVSPTLALRHAMRNPAQFVAYSRLVRMQYAANEADPNMREAGFTEFELADMPITLFKDPDGKSILSLSPSAWDPFHSSAAYGLTQIQRVSRVMGSKDMTFGAQDRRELTGDKYSVLDLIKDNIKENNNPIFAAVSELMAGKDQYGKAIDAPKDPEIGGARVDGPAYWVLSKLPAFASFQKAFGGTGKITDASGNTLQDATPGLFGTPQRDATRTETSNYVTDKGLGEKSKVLREFLGLNIKTIDLAKGRQTTLMDVRATMKSLDQQAKKAYDSEQPSPARTAKIELLQNQWLQMSVDTYRVSKWMKQHNVPEREALNEMRKMDIRVRSVKVTTPELDKFIQRSYGLGQATTP